MTGLGNMDDVYKHYLKVIEENKQLKKKLDIAVKALEEYMTFCRHPAQEALSKIKEIK